MTCLVLVSVGPPFTLRLRVKFYSSEPNCLREELTRYQFFLQLKLDILEGRLECQESTAVELAALALQCKFSIEFLRTMELQRCSLEKSSNEPLQVVKNNQNGYALIFKM